MSTDQLTCRELVEIVTDYLEGALTGAERKRFEEHVGECEGCLGYLDQIRTTIEIAGQVTVDGLTAEAREGLLVAFRDWRRD